MIDLHCHILPGIDDGPKDSASALGLALAAQQNGISKLVLTPHVYPGRWDNTMSSLIPHFEKFKQELAAADIEIDVRLGGEVHMLPESLALLDSGEMPFIGGWQGKKVVLLEMPDGQVPVGALRVAEYLLEHDVIPMIAHPERNKDVMRNPAKIEPFVRAGCLLQVTAASICGRFGRSARRTVFSLLDSGYVTIVASDMHNLTHRPPLLNEARIALNQHYASQAGELLTVENPGKLFDARAQVGLAI